MRSEIPGCPCEYGLWQCFNLIRCVSRWSLFALRVPVWWQLVMMSLAKYVYYSSFSLCVSFKSVVPTYMIEPINIPAATTIYLLV
jgi:hypothetical protein